MASYHNNIQNDVFGKGEGVSPLGGTVNGWMSEGRVGGVKGGRDGSFVTPPQEIHSNATEGNFRIVWANYYYSDGCIWKLYTPTQSME